MIRRGDTMSGATVTMTTPQVPIDILLVEDRDEEINMVEEAITETRLTNRMIVAKDAVEALLYLRQCTALGTYEDRGAEPAAPGLILLDINLAEHRGLDLLHDLRTNPKLMTIPIIILTNSLEETDLECTLAHGVTGYFLKPMDASQLRKVVRDVEEHWSLLTTTPCAN